MRQILVLVLVLSILGINHVTSQRNNWLAGLALGGVAGWAAGNYINRVRRQDALNDYLLYRSFAPRPYYWGNPWYMGRGFCKSPSLCLSLSLSLSPDWHDRLVQSSYNLVMRYHFRFEKCHGRTCSILVYFACSDLIPSID